MAFLRRPSSVALVLLAAAWIVDLARGQDVPETNPAALGLAASSSFTLALSPVNQDLDFVSTRTIQDAIATTVLVQASNSDAYLDMEAIVQSSTLQADAELLRLRFFVLATRENTNDSVVASAADASSILNAQVEAVFATTAGQNLFLSFLADSNSDIIRGATSVAVAPLAPGGSTNGGTGATTNNNRLLSTRDVVIIVIGAMIIVGVCIMLLVQFWDQGHAHHARIRAANLYRHGAARDDGTKSSGDGRNKVDAPETPSTIASNHPVDGEFNVSPETPERRNTPSRSNNSIHHHHIATQTPPSRRLRDGPPTLNVSSSNSNKLATPLQATTSPAKMPRLSTPTRTTPNWKMAIAESPRDTPPIIQDDNHFFAEEPVMNLSNNNSSHNTNIVSIHEDHDNEEEKGEDLEAAFGDDGQPITRPSEDDSEGDLPLPTDRSRSSSVASAPSECTEDEDIDSMKSRDSDVGDRNDDGDTAAAADDDEDDGEDKYTGDELESSSSSSESSGVASSGSSSSSGYESTFDINDPEDPFGVGSVADVDLLSSGSVSKASSQKSSVGDWMQTIRVVSSDKSDSNATHSETNSTSEAPPSLGVSSFGGRVSLECDMEHSSGPTVETTEDQGSAASGQDNEILPPKQKHNIV